MKKFRLLLILLVISMTMSAFVACGGEKNDPNEGVNPDGTVTIEFVGWGDAAELANYQELVNLFMEENPNITVVYKGESATTYMTTLKNRANNLPDLFYMPDYDFLEWVANGTIKDISSYFTAEELSTLWPQAVDEYYFDPSTNKLGKSETAGLYGLIHNCLYILRIILKKILQHILPRIMEFLFL